MQDYTKTIYGITKRSEYDITRINGAYVKKVIENFDGKKRKWNVLVKNVDDSVCSESEKNDKIGATNYLIPTQDSVKYKNSTKKIKLLVCFIQAHIGGAMTSLVNFLNALDTNVYDVDVMF